jgi:hypothetical protein
MKKKKGELITFAGKLPALKISGFTIVRNITLNDYPALEAILSILPIVDELIVLVGDSQDDTVERIQTLDSSKIKIIHSVWDKSMIEGGSVLAAETNKAKNFLSPDSDWLLYIQADEILHEKDYPVILEAASLHLNNPRVEGLLFNYLHFYASYNYIGDSRTWYHQEVRMIRNDPRIQSYRDAQGFRKQGKKLRVKAIEACVYHYGWVKSPMKMQEKRKQAALLWQERQDLRQELQTQELFDYAAFDSLTTFKGTHPAVMRQRIALQNWEVSLDLSQKKFSWTGKLLYWFEKRTGLRPFAFKNYRII